MKIAKRDGRLMFKIGIAVVLICLLAGFLFLKISRIDEAKVSQKPEGEGAFMLYAAKKIPEGSLIVREDIIIKETPQAKIPQGGLSKNDLDNILGCKARLPLEAGQMFSNHTVVPSPWGENPKH